MIQNFKILQVLEYLLDMSEVDIDGNDTLCGDTPLCAAAAAGKTAILKFKFVYFIVIGYIEEIVIFRLLSLILHFTC